VEAARALICSSKRKLCCLDRFLIFSSSFSLPKKTKQNLHFRRPLPSLFV
jgi:hypothetical protein